MGTQLYVNHQYSLLLRHREFIEKRTMKFSEQERARTKVLLFLRELNPGYMVSYRTREQEAEHARRHFGDTIS